MWKSAEGCSHCEAAKKLPQPCPWYVWVALVFFTSPLAYMVLNRIRQVPLPLGVGGVLSIVLAGLCVWLTHVVSAMQMPHFVRGYELTVLLERVKNDEPMILHVHKGGGQSLTVYIEGIPVSPMGRLGKPIILEVRGSYAQLGWKVLVLPTGKASDARLAHGVLNAAYLQEYRGAAESCQYLGFSSWGNLLYAACQYTSVNDMLMSKQERTNCEKEYARRFEELSAYMTKERRRANLFKEAILDTGARLSAAQGERMNIPVDTENPISAVMKVVDTTSTFLLKTNEMAATIKKRTELIEAGVARLTEALELSLPGDPYQKLEYLSGYGAEILREQRRKLTQVSTRMLEAEQLVHILGVAIMELRLWMAEDVHIRSKLFAHVRRFFQEIVTPQVRECCGRHDYLLEWYREAKKGEGNLLVNHLGECQQYRGDFEDILEVLPVIHEVDERQQRGHSRHRRRR